MNRLEHSSPCLNEWGPQAGADPLRVKRRARVMRQGLGTLLLLVTLGTARVGWLEDGSVSAGHSQRLAQAASGPAPHAGARAGGMVQLSDEVPGHCSNPRLSPGGEQVAFERRDDTDRGRQVRIVSLTGSPGDGGSAEQTVTLGSSSSSSLLSAFKPQHLPVLRDFVWMPLGPLQRAHPYVVAGAEREDAVALYLSGVGRLTAERAVEGHPAFSREGAILVFVSSRSGEGDLYAIALTEPGRPVRRLTTTEQEAELYPVWHPQQDALFFIRHGSGGDQVVRLEGVRRGPLKETLLTRGAATRTAPSVSPDGEWLAWYDNERRGDQLDLSILSLKSGAASSPRILLTNGINGERHGPAWLPDSSGLVAVQNNAQDLDPLVQVRLRDGAVSRVATGTLHNREPEVGLQRGKPYVVFTAQGRSVAAAERSWQRVYGGFLNGGHLE